LGELGPVRIILNLMWQGSQSEWLDTRVSAGCRASADARRIISRILVARPKRPLLRYLTNWTLSFPQKANNY
jgi:hypothetical protein